MKYIFFPVILICIFSLSQAQENAIIPQPLKMITPETNTAFSISKNVSIVTDHEFLQEAGILASYLKEITGFTIPVKQKAEQSFSGSLILLQRNPAGKIQKEGYVLDVKDGEIQIHASDPAGVYYGCMTLLQTIEFTKNLNAFTIAARHIEDTPRFVWRGFMLDCSRTFLSLDYLKRTIDRMSFYKLNTLHLHLTDDQGWRLEIKAWPQLTGKGSVFASNYHEPKEFEGFYSQAQMKELIKYASQRHVSIVPEIEVPGHSHAVLYAYPELSCSGKISPIFPFFFGPFRDIDDVFCAGNENTFRFFKDVMKEVSVVFPSPYIHLGGDEVAQDAWKNCEKCRAQMKALGIIDQRLLQGYVMKRVGKYVTAANKRPIGWDEVFQTGVGKETVIMIWRGQNKGIEEIKAGYDVVLCPTSNLYFDYTYETTPTKKVYSFEPIPEGVTKDEEKHYLGIQACFWSHIDRTESNIDYQIFPRLLALAERAWSDKSVTDYDIFYQRELKHEFWLNHFDVKYKNKRIDQ